MEFRFVTEYNQKALTTMAKALRKTVRKKKNRRSRIFGWVVVVLALLLMFFAGDEGFRLDLRTVVTGIVVLIMIAALIWEDQMNGYFARKRMLPGTDKAEAVFGEEEYTSETAAGRTQWKYEKIDVFAEDEAYFIFVFGVNHAQVYDKRSLSGGTEELFRSFIEEKTGKTVIHLE